MSLNLRKDPAQIVVDRINHDNGTKLVAEKLRFGNPQAIEGPNNTRIQVSGKPHSGVVGTVDLTYNRINLDTLKPVEGVESLTLYISKPIVSISELIPKINDLFDINLTPNDYVDTKIIRPSVEDGEVDFHVVAAAKSLIYTGVMIIKIADAILLQDLYVNEQLVNNYLNGFTYAYLTT